MTTRVYVVRITRHEQYEAEVPVTAETAAEAKAKARAQYDDGAITEDDFEYIEGTSHVVSARRLAADHEVEPTGSGEGASVCGWCGGPVRWTGTDAKDSPTGHTIPGPWVHVAA